MRYAIVFTLPNRLSQFIKIDVIDREIAEAKRNQLCKSKRLLFKDIQVGFMAEGFMREESTYRVNFDGYKIPRIIKNLLYGKYKNQQIR